MLTDDEVDGLPTGLMVVKGKYLKLDGNSRKINGYVFMDYRLGVVVSHYTHLVIGTNIQLQTLSMSSLHKLCYIVGSL